MAEIFSCLWDGAPGLIGQRLEDFGVSARDKVSPMSDLDLGKIYGQVAKALGNKKTGALRASRTGAADDGGDRRAGAARAGRRPGAGRRGGDARRDPLPARARHRAVPPRVHPGRRRAAQAVHRAVRQRAARRSTRATPGGAPPTGDAAAEQAAKLKKNVPYKVSKQLVELFQALGTTSWSSLRWRSVVHQIGNRTGLVLCGDLGDRRRGSSCARARRVPERRPAATPEEIRQLAVTQRAAARAPALRGQRRLLPAAREARHRDRQGRARRSTAGRLARAGLCDVRG